MGVVLGEDLRGGELQHDHARDAREAHDVVGAGWGAYVMGKPELNREIGAALEPMISSGVVRPVVGARFPLDEAAEALKLIDGRGATGKVVLDVAS